eukprot:GGOE01025841.1.p2 GENE.GGOE01025841.1~~GGOE01025841.1.p2  ORF type:complete len:115 (+),score=4.77 GGOE01025841.1:294-638(+)
MGSEGTLFKRKKSANSSAWKSKPLKEKATVFGVSTGSTHGQGQWNSAAGWRREGQAATSCFDPVPKPTGATPVVTHVTTMTTGKGAGEAHWADESNGNPGGKKAAASGRWGIGV